MMTRNLMITLAAAGSLALLLGAFGFQYIGGLAPCQLCLWQRWPHAAAVLIGVLALWLGGRVLPVLGALAALTTAAIGVFHVGVEQKWWEGLASCTVNAMEGVSGADLLNTEIVVAAPVRCDAIAWAMMGVSMAGWNVILSVVLALIWLMAARKAA
jgi:disulfide bond formation protein DsbB